jgi:choline monooxygenase
MAKEQRSEQLRLPQLLPPERYFSARDHELDMELLFRPAWNCVGILDDIPNAGDYFAIEHLGKPLLVQNQGDRVAAFHNICAHRNALLARSPKGNMPRITCGYHGWEYDRDGVVCKVPGGELLKPMSAKEFVLDRVRVETIGRLIFVALDSGTPPLEEFLGPEMWSRLRYTFSNNMRLASSWSVNYECNWKVLIENTQEDYHVSAVHFATAGNTVPYAQIVHTLEEKFSAYENRDPKFDNASSHWFASRLRSDPEYSYFQYLSYPALIFVSGPLSSHLHLLIPTSPTTCKTDIYLFLGAGKDTIVGKSLHAVMRRPATRLAKAFVEEDRLICNDVQRGIQNARFDGALSKREERVHAFQEYILRNASAPRPVR